MGFLASTGNACADFDWESSQEFSMIGVLRLARC
jgi:hypothetical protein